MSSFSINLDHCFPLKSLVQKSECENKIGGLASGGRVERSFVAICSSGMNEQTEELVNLMFRCLIVAPVKLINQSFGTVQSIP